MDPVQTMALNWLSGPQWLDSSRCKWARPQCGSDCSLASWLDHPGLTGRGLLGTSQGFRLHRCEIRKWLDKNPLPPNSSYLKTRTLKKGEVFHCNSKNIDAVTFCPHISWTLCARCWEYTDEWVTGHSLKELILSPKTQTFVWLALNQGCEVCTWKHQRLSSALALPGALLGNQGQRNERDVVPAPRELTECEKRGWLYQSTGRSLR